MICFASLTFGICTLLGIWDHPSMEETHFFFVLHQALAVQRFLYKVYSDLNRKILIDFELFLFRKAKNASGLF